MAELGVSVVIATGPEKEGLESCLEALEAQREERTEVFVVSDRAYTPEVRERFPWVVWVPAAASDLVPQRWAIGFTRARHEVVALTTGQFTPCRDWLSVVRRSHQLLDGPAVGGPIDPPEDRRGMAWATYFLRYSAYLACRGEGEAPDLAGDNASYKREAVLEAGGAHRDGLWEQELHRVFRQKGQALWWVPAMRVAQRGEVDFCAFLCQRFRHGLRFGRTRMSGKGWTLRASAIVLSPLIPAVFFAKIAARVFRSRVHLGAFLRSLPVLLCFLLAWSAGEAWGYLSSRSSTSPRESALSEEGPRPVA